MKKKGFALMLCLCLALSFLPVGTLADEIDSFLSNPVTIVQKTPNSRTAVVSLPNLEEIKESADTVKITVTMSYGDTVTEEAIFTKAISEINATEKTFEIDFPYYGKWSATIQFLLGESIVQKSDTMIVPVSASEYNIICGTATTDVLIESLKYFNGDGGINAALPTIVTLNRYWQYDWGNLPDNMYRNPLLSAKDNGAAQNWDVRMDHMKQYVGDLYEINPDTVFHFYITDYHMYAFAKICYANKIPAGHYSITMVTDGSGSYTAFQEAYSGTDDAQSVHDQLVNEYTAFRNGVYNDTVSNYNILPSGNIRKYNYAILDAEESVGTTAKWWVVRKSTDTFGLEKDASFQAKVLADTRISNNYINSLLNSMSSAGKDDAFKSLYKFVDDDFQAARDDSKKIMMFLGTTASIEKATSVMDFINFMVTYYGDEYAYFYKGHPGNYLMDLEKYKQPYLDMGVGVLEASIAAELFIYFNPDIAIAGYESSLFQNMGNDDQDVGLFRRTQQVANADVNLGLVLKI